jgi:hypothetical protein
VNWLLFGGIWSVETVLLLCVTAIQGVNQAKRKAGSQSRSWGKGSLRSKSRQTG